MKHAQQAASSLLRAPYPTLAEGMGVQVSRLPMIYEVNIFLTNRHLPIPEVLPSERLLVEQKGACGFYHVIARCARKGCGSAY